MSRQPAESFKGYDIFTIAIPTKDGTWSAMTEIQKMGAEGLEISQSFSGPFEAATEAEAKNAALREAEKKIVDMIASPVGGDL
ncbi:hypothetical protein [Undibacterium sp.]|jgi:hypothetical protein|uniref:hypothetical protein n=1 Tax=Undibacterium sp. TaxID=1914977 RepID=UPI002C60CCB0|nr:hypothetical protein [Undibacterium sp.]HTD06646.1 hypothetical protein [Undibacterium sp.]